ncbi:hypothetical protein NQT62_13290 [Limnobacter humi]|uniref:DUF4156 domain-containing protein n=1 Tax=Limnobacter humi TaxID=1778671 RepID=A0ABT1WIS2_9BURK|nr:hypothetical protein [Limnobacter humi]MCQ8897410.1 hypothetical protein [Limnobacter humi]
MTRTNFSRLVAPLALTLSALALSACVAVVPAPGQSPASGENTTQPASLCNMEGPATQKLQDGTTLAEITQTCEQTEVKITNNHAKHPKRCNVVIGGQGSELYIQPGESRSLTQTGPVAKADVRINCLNDWNRPK